jgi:hypothetical protein
MWFRIPLLVLGVFIATAIGRGNDTPPADLADDEKLLGDANIATDGSGLLEFFRKRTLSAAEMERIDFLVQQLGDRNFRKREAASNELREIGSAALPALRRALAAKDLESRRRAAVLLKDIQSGTLSGRLCAAARLLQHRRPQGAVRVLIDYLPFVEDADVEAEVLGTLTLLGVQAGKVEPALIAVLQSRAPAQRAVGAMLAGWAGTPEQRRAAKTLLRDPDATVRFRAAQGILAGRDKAAVPTLIALLEGVPLELSQRAEDLLQRVAESSSPSITLGTSAAGRQVCAAAWRDWSRSNLEQMDLAERDVSLPLFNINLRAKEVALRWICSLDKRDLNTWQKTSAVPFALADFNFQVFSKREELDHLLQHTGAAHDARRARTMFVVKDVVSVDQYLKYGSMSSTANGDVAEVVPPLRDVLAYRLYM